MGESMDSPLVVEWRIISGNAFLARSVSEGNHDGPLFPDNGDTLSSHPFPPRAVVLALRSFSWSPSLTLRARNRNNIYGTITPFTPFTPSTGK
jgi:hypothetical protein